MPVMDGFTMIERDQIAEWALNIAPPLMGPVVN